MQATSALCAVCRCELAQRQISGRRVCDRVHCSLEYQRHLQRGGKLCAACGKLMPNRASGAGQALICENQLCRRWLTLLSRPNAELCKYCGVSIDLQGGVGRVCTDTFCKQSSLADMAAESAGRYRQRKKTLTLLAISNWMYVRAKPTGDSSLTEHRENGSAAMAEQILPEVATEPSNEITKSQCTVPQRTPLPTIIVPAIRRGMSRQPHRVEKLRNNLMPIAEKAIEELSMRSPRPDIRSSTESAEEASHSDLQFQTLAGHACRLCRGHCCKNGGEHAYLTVEDLMRWVDQVGIDSAEQAVQRFLDHVPTQSIDQSCIYHTDTGCQLPRSMRSATCNRHYCSELRGVRQQWREAPSEDRRVLVASTNIEDSLSDIPRIWACESIQIFKDQSVKE